MGNNNSSFSNGHVNGKSRHLHPDYHHRKYGASSSDLGDSSGNRMRKGYLPTRGYHGHHAKLPSPHKVLPSVTPSVLLKPTSNGAILHQGGTISGRKLLSELDMRKRSTASCPGNGDMMGPSSGRSTPNLSMLDYNNGGLIERNGPRRASSKGGNSSSRDYDSEPDLRDMDDSPHDRHHHHNNHHRRDDSSPQRSISPVPNSFTLIQESPAKKQIRTKKKGKAPPPPISPGEQLQRFGGGGGCSGSGNGNMPSCCSPNSPQMFSPCGESKKASSRLFKTKAESRLASGPRSPEICSDLEMSRGNVVRASMNANRFSRGDRDRSSVHSLAEAGLCTSKSSPMDHDHHHHLSNRKHSSSGISSSRNNPEVTKVNALARDRASASTSSGNGNIERTSNGEANRSTTTSRTAATANTNNNTTGASSSAGSSNIISLINQSGVTKEEQVPKKSSFIPSSSTTAPYGQSQSSNSACNPSPVNHKVSSSSSKNGKAFASSSNDNANNNNAHHNLNGRRKSTAAPAAPTTATPSTTTTTSATVTENTKNKKSHHHHQTNNNNSNNDNSNKSKFYFGMQEEKPPPTKSVSSSQPNGVTSSNNNNSSNKQNVRRASESVPAAAKHQHHHQPSDSDNNNNDCRSRLMTTVLNDKVNDRLTSSSNSNHHYYQEKISSSTSSELLQIKQDSGSFDTSERVNDDHPHHLPNNHRESSSELSSSDLDIPLQIRPTLPLKKLGLPRFSPSQAWRALDTVSGLSPEMSFSGRSYSGSEDNYGHDRIQPPRMRQLPPSRINHHERSAGDSGISAGDGGSPANNHDLLGEPCVTPSISNPLPPPPPIAVGGSSNSRNYKSRAPAPNKSHNQLRNSSSDENKCWTPEQDLDESSESSEFEDQPMSPTHHPLPPSHSRNHHSSSNIATRVLPAGLRSRNAAGLGIASDSDQYHLERPGNLYVRSRKVLNGGIGGQKTHEDMKRVTQVSGVNNQPWRHESNLRQSGSNGNWFLSRSLNSLNLIGNGEYDNIEQQELRLVLPEQDDEIVEQDDVDEDVMLHLPPPDSSVSKNMTKMVNGRMNNNVFNNEYDEVGGGVSSRLESEIGYGPSSMNFSSPLPSPSAVKINRSKMNRRSVNGEQHINKRQMVTTTHLLSDEFERDQQDVIQDTSANVRYGASGAGGAGGVRERRPFSHIMYLPAYDARRSSSSGTRRTKSVDNLNFSEMALYQQRKPTHFNSPASPHNHIVNGNRQRQQRSRSPFEYSGGAGGGGGVNRTKNRVVKRDDPEEPFERSQSVPPFTAEEEEERRRSLRMEQKAANLNRRQQLQHQQQQQQQEQQEQRDREQRAAADAAAAAEREQKKRKFKFQSTLRVMERKKIEEQLSREAEEKERRRLEEKEQMRRVEEEFQRKRVREKVMELEAAAANNKVNMGKNKLGHPIVENTNRYDVNFEPRITSSNNGGGVGGGGDRNNFQRNSGRSSNISCTTTTTTGNNHNNSNMHHHQSIFQRQEPEGAPASVTNGTGGDLRKELINASKNRNAFPGSQELSEFCTPTGQRQYFDYRRGHHEGDGMNHRSSGPTTRYYNSSSSSDIFPVTSRRDRKRGGGSSVISSSKSSVGYLRPTVHPQVVCDIPVKPLPYVVNFSRLSSSNMDLLTEDRPRSGLGNASVLSDNYRKDWAHHHSRGNGPVRASSVISLHSAPPLSHSENFRHSSVDLTGGSLLHTPPQSPRQSKYSTSPSASPVSHSRPLSSPEERFHPNGDLNQPSRLRTSSLAQEMWNGDCVTGNKTVVMLNTPATSSAMRSSSPIPSYQPAPVPFRKTSFRPVDFNPSSNSSGLSPAHAFHHASAKLTTPTPVN